MSDAIKFECPECGKISKVPGAYAGKKGKCPSCKATIQVPDPNEGADDDSGGGDDAPAPADRKPCPYCGEEIKKTAKKCRHCGEFLDKKLAVQRRNRSQPKSVHIVLKIWGILVMVLAGFGLLGSALNLIMALGGGGRGGGILLFAVFIQVIIQVVILRLGYGLTKGQKTAVIGMAIFACLGLLGGMAIMAGRNGGVPGLIVVGVVLCVYGPPVGVGIAKWKDLT